MTKKIGIIVGSLRKDSYNRKAAEAFANLLPEGYEATFVEVGDLPLYNEDLDVEGKVPASWTRFREELKAVDGVYFFTPEYNRSLPATIKNALDVGSRPYGESVWDSKPALVVSVSQGAVSGFGANHHLRQSLVFLNMPTLQQPEAYIGNVANLVNEEGKFIEDTVNFFQLITDKYVEFFEKLTK
ncbi:NAD(P)H-dependent oxidoreductase [Enterococcus saccharolyticus]|uniref:NADPH-dependent FMN reductase n=1 Tax=Candidatus Enterococcus willemsii TaxID=1857215 RepID=A0ABQ6YYQ0_9ENTE|nr:MULTISPECIES: NAD(P)H-dependent oxidoreductase [Enterococcus]KAF1303285.1 NADPH-dependent FMN reductase [Enterococcus sp. CU12B]MCD5001749.1 NAD(P)H-dependent oxidoreductase [Enterococcus saccharolyticus]